MTYPSEHLSAGRTSAAGALSATLAGPRLRLALGRLSPALAFAVLSATTTSRLLLAVSALSVVGAVRSPRPYERTGLRPAWTAWWTNGEPIYLDAPLVAAWRGLSAARSWSRQQQQRQSERKAARLSAVELAERRLAAAEREYLSVVRPAPAARAPVRPFGPRQPDGRLVRPGQRPGQARRRPPWAA